MQQTRPAGPASAKTRHSCFLAAITVYLLVFGVVASPAGATSDTGYIYKADVSIYLGPTINACVRGIIADVADNVAWAGSRDSSGTGCTTTVTADPGDLGAQAFGYRDGAVCGFTSAAYNNVSTSSFGIGGVTCTNPAGLQAFKTNAYGFFLTGSGSYTSYSQMTANQSY